MGGGELSPMCVSLPPTVSRGGTARGGDKYRYSGNARVVWAQVHAEATVGGQGRARLHMRVSDAGAGTGTSRARNT